MGGPSVSDTNQPLSIPAAPVISPFTITVDNREQSPFTFHEFYELQRIQRQNQKLVLQCPYVVQCESGTLQTGDYSLRGFHSQICIERKSLPDLVGTLTSGRERFIRELDRMMAPSFEFTAVVVEASWLNLIHSEEYRTAIKKSVVSSVIAFQQRYRTVQWHFAGSRREAERWTLRSVERFWNDRQPEK
jgi:DNA excision repair protein ERCC-4